MTVGMRKIWFLTEVSKCYAAGMVKVQNTMNGIAKKSPTGKPGSTKTDAFTKKYYEALVSLTKICTRLIFWAIEVKIGSVVWPLTLLRDLAKRTRIPGVTVNESASLITTYRSIRILRLLKLTSNQGKLHSSALRNPRAWCQFTTTNHGRLEVAFTRLGACVW